MGVQLSASPATSSGAVEQAHRDHWGRVLASTLRFARDLDIAEESTADAFELALRTWTTTGVPRSVEAWLITAARRRAIDRIRREARLRQRLTVLEGELMGQPEVAVGAQRTDEPDAPDDELRLAILCAHPALSEKSQVTLMLRLACGASTQAISAAFLSKPAAVAARLTRAKRTVTGATRSFTLPDDEEVDRRLPAVRAATYLTYTLGHTAGDGPDLRNQALIGHARHLAATLAGEHPDADNAGLLALILLTEARAPGRVEGGIQVLLEDADRSTWDVAQINAGLILLERALRARVPGRYTVQAAIAAEHTRAASFAVTDWARVVELYSQLLVRDANPTFAVGRAVAIGRAVSAAAGLADLDELADMPGLSGYPYLHAARADCLVRLGASSEARDAYRLAAGCARNDAEREFFAARG